MRVDLAGPRGSGGRELITAPLQRRPRNTFLVSITHRQPPEQGRAQAHDAPTVHARAASSRVHRAVLSIDVSGWQLCRRHDTTGGALVFSGTGDYELSAESGWRVLWQYPDHGRTYWFLQESLEQLGSRAECEAPTNGLYIPQCPIAYRMPRAAQKI